MSVLGGEALCCSLPAVELSLFCLLAPGRAGKLFSLYGTLSSPLRAV